MQLLRCPLSLRPRSGEQVPPLTAQVARASNPGGTTAIWVRDRLDGLWHDEDFADWYPRDGRPGLSPAQLATVCVLQFLLGLSDRQAAEAVRCRIDFKYAMAMELDDSRLPPQRGSWWLIPSFYAARESWRRARWLWLASVEGVAVPPGDDSDEVEGGGAGGCGRGGSWPGRGSGRGGVR